MNKEEIKIKVIGKYNEKNVYFLMFDFSKAFQYKDFLKKYLSNDTLTALISEPQGSGGGFSEKTKSKEYVICIDNTEKYNKTEAELEFISLHELGHVLNGHLDEKYSRSRGLKKIKRETEANEYVLNHCSNELKDEIFKIIKNRFPLSTPKM